MENWQRLASSILWLYMSSSWSLLVPELLLSCILQLIFVNVRLMVHPRVYHVTG